MKRVILIAHVFIFSLGHLTAQPSIQWQYSYGGSKKDSANSIKQTADGGFIIIGNTLSLDGDILNGKGTGDWWVLKTNSLGQKEWATTLGGSSIDIARDVEITSEGGYIIVGESFSTDGDVTFNHGGGDVWMVKLNSAGIKLWDKSLGGSASDEAYSIKQTMDGGYLLCGATTSTDGDVTQNFGFFDIWVVKTDSIGNVEWERTYGGFDGEEHAYSLDRTNDGGFVFSGVTNSTNGHITDAKGNYDGWVVKIDHAGDIIWQKTLGGIAADISWKVKQDESGNIWVIGYWGSGDVLPNWHGYYDYWITKLDANGEIVWQRIYGGSLEDWARSIDFLPNGDLVIAGATRSGDGDVLQNDGYQDVWLIGLDSTGILKWEKTLGGIDAEIAYDVVVTSTQEIVIAGESRSENGDVTHNQGSADYWIVKLAPETSSTSAPTAIQLNLYPNPAQNWLRLNLPITEPDMQISITDAQGRVVLAKTIRSDERLDISALEPGVYGVTAVAQSGQVYAGKLVKG